MTVRELENRMSAREITEWMVYYGIEPFGDTQDDFRAGLICSTFANVMGAGKKGKALKPTDFINIYQQPVQNDVIGKRQEQLKQMAMFKQLAAQSKDKNE